MPTNDLFRRMPRMDLYQRYILNVHDLILGTIEMQAITNINMVSKFIDDSADIIRSLIVLRND